MGAVAIGEPASQDLEYEIGIGEGREQKPDLHIIERKFLPKRTHRSSNVDPVYIGKEVHQAEQKEDNIGGPENTARHKFLSDDLWMVSSYPVWFGKPKKQNSGPGALLAGRTSFGFSFGNKRLDRRKFLLPLLQEDPVRQAAIHPNKPPAGLSGAFSRSLVVPCRSKYYQGNQRSQDDLRCRDPGAPPPSACSHWVVIFVLEMMFSNVRPC
jgi:hypothetical protein